MNDETESKTAETHEGGRLLRRLRPFSQTEEAAPAKVLRRPPSGAKCEKCGGKQVSAQPFFSAGSGLAFRPNADDVRCGRCGHVGSPSFGSE